LAVFQNDRKHVGRNLIQTIAAIFVLKLLFPYYFT